MTKEKRKPLEPQRPFYDEEGYTGINPYLPRTLQQYPEKVINPLEGINRKGKWNEWSKGKELHLEIGPGKGKFVTEYAVKNPDVNVIAVEMKFRRFYKVAKKLAAAKADNGYVMRFDANYLNFIFDEAELDQLFMFFPDPWWNKKKHYHMRMVTPEFLDVVYKILKPGGAFDIKTDHELYYNHMLDMIGNSPFTITRQSRDLANSEYAADNIETIFEEKFRERGIKAHYVRIEKL